MLLTRGYYHTFSFLWVEQHCIRRTPFSYFLDTWLQLSIYSSYVISKAERDESSANMSQSTSVDEILNGRSFI